MKLLLALLGKHELAYVNMTSKNVYHQNRISVASFLLTPGPLQNYRIFNVKAIV